MFPTDQHVPVRHRTAQSVPRRPRAWATINAEVTTDASLPVRSFTARLAVPSLLLPDSDTSLNTDSIRTADRGRLVDGFGVQVCVDATYKLRRPGCEYT